MQKHDITKLSIKSASRIFRFLNFLLEKKNLDPLYFENSLKKFSEEELFFLFEYSSKYFEYKEGSFLYNWVKEVNHIYGYEDAKDYLAEIISNAGQIITIVTNIETLDSLEKGYFYFKKSKEAYFKFDFSEPIIQDIEVETNIYPLKSYKRIPLYVEEKRFNNFKEEFYRLFNICLDKHSIEKLFENTFDYPANPQNLQFLYLDISKSKQSVLNEAIKEVSKLYKEKILPRYNNPKQIERDKTIEKTNAKIVKKITNRIEGDNQFSSHRAKILLKQLATPKKIDRTHFMIAMYNSFPEIRESFKKSKCKSFKEFFAQRIKNMKKA